MKERLTDYSLRCNTSACRRVAMPMKQKMVMLTIVAVIVLQMHGCEPASFVTVPESGLSGRMVFNAITGNGSNLGIIVLDLNLSGVVSGTVVHNGIEPRVSTNSLELVYTGTDSGKIDIMRSDIAGHNAIDLTPDSTVIDSWPDWSPGDSSIVFSRVLPYPPFKEEVCVMHRDGTSLHKVSDTTQLQTATMPRWSPDGSTLAFVGDLFGGASPDFSLYTISPDGSHEILLDHVGGMLPASLPAWSPNSQRIAYGRTTQSANMKKPGTPVDTSAGLLVIDLATGISRKIYVPGVIVAGQGYSWLTNDDVICIGENPLDTAGGWSVYRISVSTPTNWKLLARGFRPVPTAVSSPDGDYVAIVGTRDSSSAFALFVVGSDGMGFRKLKDIAVDPEAFVNDWGDIEWVR